MSMTREELLALGGVDPAEARSTGVDARGATHDEAVQASHERNGGQPKRRQDVDDGVMIAGVTHDINGERWANAPQPLPVGRVVPIAAGAPPRDGLRRNAAGQCLETPSNPQSTHEQRLGVIQERLRHLQDRLEAVERLMSQALETLAQARAQWVASRDALALNLRDLRTLLDVKAFDDDAPTRRDQR